MDDDDDIVRRAVGLGGGEPRWCEHTGTKALMVAVLEGGIRDYCGPAGRKSREAEAWVRSNRRGAFSFMVVCETLGLEPTAVRQTLVRLKEQFTPPPRRLRPDVRKKRPTTGSRS